MTTSSALTLPNRISIGRLLMVAPYIWLLLNQQEYHWARYAALGIFVLMAVSDAVDGFLARRLDMRTRLGGILDPLADKVLIISSAVLLRIEASAVPGYRLADWVVLAIVGKDLWVILGFVVVHLVTDRFLIAPSISGKASTVVQALMVVAVLAAPDLDALAAPLGSGLMFALELAVTGLCGLAVISYMRLGLKFVAARQKPLDENHRHEK